MTALDKISILKKHGVIEASRLSSGQLLFATPRRECAPAVEIVIHDEVWVTQITIADAFWFEFAQVDADQRIAEALVEDIVRYESHVVVEHR